jgi:hypothetical protein
MIAMLGPVATLRSRVSDGGTWTSSVSELRDGEPLDFSVLLSASCAGAQSLSSHSADKLAKLLVFYPTVAQSASLFCLPYVLHPKKIVI